MYSEVNEILDGTASEEILNKYAPVMESLMSAKELADILKANSAAPRHHGAGQRRIEIHS